MDTMACFRKKSIFLMGYVISLSAITSTSAFGGVAIPRNTAFHNYKQITRHSTQRYALIYGWDGDDSDTNSGRLSYIDEDTSTDPGCPPIGIAMAESLSYDKQREGHLARLAAAFSPPERALKLDQIERVHVICVREDNIEIEAIICEDGGCLSLSVPVKFPRACAATSSDVLEGCVYQNLDDLNEEAGSSMTVVKEDDDSSLEELCLLNSSFERLPDWWIPPECDANLAVECENIKQLLNEEEFLPDSAALAQDALRRLAGGSDYSIKQVKVAIVGPAGICFKVRAKYLPEFDTTHTLDILYPFGGAPMTTPDSLRAAVLGAVAAAEGG